MCLFARFGLVYSGICLRSKTKLLQILHRKLNYGIQKAGDDSRVRGGDPSVIGSFAKPFRRRLQHGKDVSSVLGWVLSGSISVDRFSSERPL